MLPDSVTQTFAALLKFRLTSILRRHFCSLKRVTLGDRAVNMFGVFGPVCCNAKKTSGNDFLSQQIDKISLHDATLVVPFFWPWIGKKKVYAPQRSVRNLISHYLHGIVTYDPDIRQFPVFEFDQASADAGFVDFDANEIRIGIVCRHFGQQISVSETDFQDVGCPSAKNRVEIDRQLIVIQAVHRHEALYGLALSRSQAPRAANETAYGSSG